MMRAQDGFISAEVATHCVCLPRCTKAATVPDSGQILSCYPIIPISTNSTEEGRFVIQENHLLLK